eukprot:XP_003725611.1 PREDICTED: zinc finger protein 532-like [Strongylocentrotus purpuratus]
MADIVEEQMGDILSAFGIPDLAKHIFPIPLPPLDDEEDEGKEKPKDESKENHPKEDKPKEKEGEGEKEGEEEADKEKDASDAAMDVDKSGKDGDGKDEVTKSTGEEEIKDDQGSIEEDAAMETDEGTDSSAAVSQNEDEAPSQDGKTETSTEQPQKDIPDLGLKQSVASLHEGETTNQESSLIKQLLKSTSKPVMTSRLQDDLPPPDASFGVPEEPDVEEPPLESLTSTDDFNSFLDRCKENRELMGMKIAIMGRASCVSTYRCPNLTEEQMKVLDMGKEIFQCPGCNDTYLFKASLDAHLDRRTVLVTFRCKWCTGRQNLVFYNKCTFLAHLHNHDATESEIEKVKLQASISPVNALDCFKIFTKLTAPVKIDAASKPTVKKSSIPSNTPHLKSQSLVSLQATSKSPHALINQGNTTKREAITMFPNNMDKVIHLDKLSSFVCMGCKRRYERLSHLRAHLDRPHPEPSTPGYKGPLQQCTICKLVVANACKLIMHNIIHTAEIKTPIPCPECGCLFTDLKSLLIHQNDGCLHWMTRPLFKCSFCTKYATTFQGLIKHFEQNHVEVFFKCPLCQLAFRNNQSASEHSLQVHKLTTVTYSLLRKCPFCKSVYSERGMLSNHFDCHYQAGLIKIEKFVFSCPLCSKPFDFGRTLRKHLADEHGRSSSNMFNCDLCLCSFSTIDSVMHHRNVCAMKPKIKISTKPAQPEEKNAAQPTNKPVVCGECGDMIPNMNTVQKHMFEKHKDKMEMNLAGLKKKQEVTTVAKDKIEAIKPKGTEELVKTSVVAKREAPLIVERFTDLKCGKCQFMRRDRLLFEKHILGHKTEDSLSQCHQCGLCFTVEGSLKKHLFIKHRIKNMALFNSFYEDHMPKWEEDMKKKKVEEKEKESTRSEINEENEGKTKVPAEAKDEKMEEEKVDETSLFKCKVCKVEFENDKALTVHARSHGLAYLQHTLTKSPEKAVRMQVSKPAASPIKMEERSPDVADKPEIKPIVPPSVKGTIPSDTDSSISSEDISSIDGQIWD